MPATKAISAMPSIDRIMDYEAGELDQEQTVELFQELIDSGLAWSLQGSYGRTATALINAGLCTKKG
jgi:hypothetical protein